MYTRIYGLIVLTFRFAISIQVGYVLLKIDILYFVVSSDVKLMQIVLVRLLMMQIPVTQIQTKDARVLSTRTHIKLKYRLVLSIIYLEVCV